MPRVLLPVFGDCQIWVTERGKCTLLKNVQRLHITIDKHMPAKGEMCIRDSKYTYIYNIHLQ